MATGSTKVRKNRIFRGQDMGEAEEKRRSGRKKTLSQKSGSDEGWTSISGGGRPVSVDPVVARVQAEQKSVVSALKGLTASDFISVRADSKAPERRSSGTGSRFSRKEVTERISENQKKIEEMEQKIRELDAEEEALSLRLRKIIEEENRTRQDSYAKVILESGLSMAEVREKLGMPGKHVRTSKSAERADGVYTRERKDPE